MPTMNISLPPELTHLAASDLADLLRDTAPQRLAANPTHPTP